MLSLFLTHLEGYKKQALLSPILIILEVICELLLPLVMAEIVDVAIPAGDVGQIFRLGAQMLLLAGAAMACGVGSAKYATLPARALAETCVNACSTKSRTSRLRTSTAFPPRPSSPV